MIQLKFHLSSGNSVTRKSTCMKTTGIPPPCSKYMLCCSSWGYPNPCPGTWHGQGVPHPADRGYSIPLMGVPPDLGWGSPHQQYGGIPPLGLDGGTPHPDLGWEDAQSWPGMGHPPSPSAGSGYLTHQDLIGVPPILTWDGGTAISNMGVSPCQDLMGYPHWEWVDGGTLSLLKVDGVPPTDVDRQTFPSINITFPCSTYESGNDSSMADSYPKDWGLSPDRLIFRKFYSVKLIQ